VKEKEEHKEQYNYEEIKRFAVDQMEYFRVIRRDLQTDPEKAHETPEMKAGK
jgi:hypothetical protein